MSAPRITELLQVALEVLEEEGLENLGVGTISRRAGIKPPSLYKQFESKADIENQLADLGFRLWGEGLGETLQGLPDAAGRRDRIAAIASTYRELGLTHPQLFRLMNARPFLGPQLVAAVAQQLPQGYEALFPASEVAFSLWAWGHGLLVLEIAGRFPPEIDLDSMWDRLVDTVAALEA
jgi:AcrR family transcriptional regulator